MGLEIRKLLAVIAAAAVCLLAADCCTAQGIPRPADPSSRPPDEFEYAPLTEESWTEESSSLEGEFFCDDDDCRFQWGDDWEEEDDCEVDLGPFRNRLSGAGSLYGGAEYLLARPRFSQAVFEVRRRLITDETTVPEQSFLIDETVEYDFDYDGSFRSFVGYRFGDCGGDVQFTYWRLTGSASAIDGPADVVGGTLIIAGVLENNPGQGEFLTGSASVDADLFDIDFARCLPLGGPIDPCDPCGMECACPRWDIRWMAGARIADIERHASNFIGPAEGPGTTFGDINARFTGAGPRVGMQGRRYFGADSQISLYTKGNIALLIGDYTIRRARVTPGDEAVPTVTTLQLDNFSRMIPVSEIEVGGGWYFGRRAFVSAGWFFQCWWDQGAAEQIGGTNFGPLDSANIMAFDGLFVRAEMFF